MTFRRLDDSTLVAGQIGPGEITEAAALGVGLIVNNRPDGEEPGQPDGASIEAAARAAGLDYRHIPVAGGIAPEQVEAMAESLASGAKVLAYCRSGTRSAYLWALARARIGADADELIAGAASAGYDLSSLAAHLRR